eukprot:CAMPEP_0202922154 /NCGR_PEP_ID=MMETSP1392-20130828/77775_1 /ASSEMBLY_ACC=CAM_ASM_000868 /TAXON_ID=225041 /ORGANISM="Chlamydomonas chlamydogama, Strain SAG 11-48b" /LENGTH=149 /DNA_ID=CAMNT_0049615767 /DNA_START=486 /DNA_END=936 /DNA_ORIENTATION=+
MKNMAHMPPHLPTPLPLSFLHGDRSKWRSGICPDTQASRTYTYTSTTCTPPHALPLHALPPHALHHMHSTTCLHAWQLSTYMANIAQLHALTAHLHRTRTRLTQACEHQGKLDKVHRSAPRPMQASSGSSPLAGGECAIPQARYTGPHE